MTSAQAGANYNTSRIKGLTSNLSASYSYSSKDAKERTLRTSFLEGNDNMQSESDFTGIARDNRLVVSGSMVKDDEGDFNFYIRPSMTFTDSERTTDMTSSTSGSDGIVNDSRSGRSYASKKLTFTTSAYAGAGNLGKEGRNIYVSGNLNTASGRGSSSEFSRTDFATGNVDVRNLLYDRNSGSYSISGRFGFPYQKRDRVRIFRRQENGREHISQTVILPQPVFIFYIQTAEKGIHFAGRRFRPRCTPAPSFPQAGSIPTAYAIRYRSMHGSPYLPYIHICICPRRSAGPGCSI